MIKYMQYNSEMRFMNNKVMILSENKFLKDGLRFEIEKLGFKAAVYASELDERGILIVDTDTVSSFERATSKIIYIISDKADESEYRGECSLKRPFSTLELDNMLLLLASDSVMPEVHNSQMNNQSIAVYDGYIVMNGARIELTKNEMLIFSELWKNKGKAVSREQLDNVIGANRDGNIVTVYINHLREKLSQISEKRIIKTIRGGGYIISEI